VVRIRRLRPDPLTRQWQVWLAVGKVTLSSWTRLRYKQVLENNKTCTVRMIRLPYLRTVGTDPNAFRSSGASRIKVALARLK